MLLLLLQGCQKAFITLFAVDILETSKHNHVATVVVISEAVHIIQRPNGFSGVSVAIIKGHGRPADVDTVQAEEAELVAGLAWLHPPISAGQTGRMNFEACLELYLNRQATSGRVTTEDVANSLQTLNAAPASDGTISR